MTMQLSHQFQPRDSINSNSQDEDPPQNRTTSQARACSECCRKKTKCNKSLPRCSLCVRAGRECVYPVRRKRPTKPWLTKRFFETEDAESLNQMLDRIDASMLEDTLRRRGERLAIPTRSSSQTNSPTPPNPAIRTEMAEPTPSTEEEVDMTAPAAETDPIVVQHETRFDGHSFDPDLAPWPVGSFFDASGLDAPGIDPLSGDLGGLPDLSVEQMQAFNMDVSQNFAFGFFPSATPILVGQAAVNGLQREYAISIPAHVVDDTIDVFFKEIAGWLPLFHRPRFYDEFLIHGENPERYSQLSLEKCLMLNSICALAARFSTLDYFAEVPIKSRAEPFLSHAAQLFQDSMKLDTPVKPSLTLLQGILLLGWYHQVCGSSGRCGSLISISCRLAYDLGLNNIDQNILETEGAPQWTSVKEWSRKEELRRTWWLIWELDMFSGSCLQRPHTIDKLHMNVLLPVSDRAWFANEPVPSVAVIPSTFQVWKTLKDRPDSDGRAYFLVASCLQAFGHDLVLRRYTTPQMLSDFQAGMACFRLSLPKQLQLSASHLTFDDDTFSESNWIASTHLMLLSTRNLIRLAMHRKCPNLMDVPFSVSTLEDEKVVCRVIRDWDSHYIARACPLVAATLLGPSAINAKTACRQAANSEEPRPMYLELLKLVLGFIGSYWQIGTSVLDLMRLLQARRPIADLVNSHETDIDRLPLLHPGADDEEAIPRDDAGTADVQSRA